MSFSSVPFKIESSQLGKSGVPYKLVALCKRTGPCGGCPFSFPANQPEQGILSKNHKPMWFALGSPANNHQKGGIGASALVCELSLSYIDGSKELLVDRPVFAFDPSRLFQAVYRHLSPVCFFLIKAGRRNPRRRAGFQDFWSWIAPLVSSG